MSAPPRYTPQYSQHPPNIPARAFSSRAFSSRAFLLHICVLQALLILVGVGKIAYAGEPPDQPLLRIDGSMHTAVINRIDVDQKGAIAVTGSSDKTAKVWRISDGNLLRTLRLPINGGQDGAVNAVALAPKGDIAVVSGVTGFDWDKSTSAYVYDVQTGDMIQRVDNLPRAVYHLRFSPDGRFLVVCMAGQGGIRVYRTDTWAMVGEDRKYGDSSLGADFNAANELVTTSDDGYVRLYDNTFKLAASYKDSVARNPMGVAFAPNGKQIIVGMEDMNRAVVLDGYDLHLVQELDATGSTATDRFSTVTWSVDGKTVYASGAIRRNGQYVLRMWDNNRGSFGAAREVPITRNTVQALRPLAKGGVVFSSHDPRWGVIDAAGRTGITQSGETLDFRINIADLRLSADGTRVAFKSAGDKNFMIFDATMRNLRTDVATPAEDLLSPIISTAGIHVENWQDKRGPSLNGVPLPLGEYESSRSLAISLDGKSFILGSEWNVMRFSETGKLLWTIPAPAIAWNVNVSDDGRLVVGLFADGTVRWFRTVDGREVLSLFVHQDRRHWVAYTPSGYFMASPGSLGMVGWHVNHSKDVAADFFPAERFQNVFNRPDVVEQVLKTLDDTAAAKSIDESMGKKFQTADVSSLLPPVVTIVSPLDGEAVKQERVAIRYKVRSPTGESISDVQIFVDGRPVAKERGIKRREGTAPIKGKDGVEEEGIVEVTLPKRDSLVSIIAGNSKAASVPATVQVRWNGSDEFVVKPKLYVLSVGVSNYDDKDLKLKYAAKDARDFAASLKSQEGGIYREVQTKILADASQGEVLDGLEWLEKEMTAKDVAMVFVAGHGVNDRTGDYYYLARDSDIERLRRTGVRWDQFKSTVSNLPGKTLLFVDTCHSGNVMGSRRSTSGAMDSVVHDLTSAESGVVVFASATGKQYALEDDAWSNGAFTKALVEALSGKAAYQGDGRVTINMLDLYLSERVKTLTGGQQTPVTAKPTTVADYPIAITK